MARIVRRDHQNSPLIRGVTLQAKLGSSIGDIPASVGLVRTGVQSLQSDDPRSGAPCRQRRVDTVTSTVTRPSQSQGS